MLPQTWKQVDEESDDDARGNQAQPRLEPYCNLTLRGPFSNGDVGGECLLVQNENYFPFQSSN